MSGHDHSFGTNVLLAGLIGGLWAHERESNRLADYQARFEIPNVHRPLDLVTGLYHPHLAGNRQQVYDELMVGLGVAEECHGIVYHDTWGPCTYGGIWGMLRELEHDAEVTRRRNFR